MDPERRPFPSELAPPGGAWPGWGAWPPAATISESSPSESLGGSSSEPSGAQSPAPVVSLDSLGRPEAGLGPPLRGARRAGSRGGVGGPGPGGPWGGRASSGAELCLSTSMAPRRCSSSAPSGGRRAASGASSCGRCELSSSFWRKSSADISSLAVGTARRGSGSSAEPLPPRPRPQPKHIPGQILLPQELLLPGEHLRLGRGQEAVTWGEGDRPRGRVAEWSRASEARPGLSLASTRAGMGSPGALMDTGSVIDIPDGPAPTAPPRAQGTESHTRLLLTWGLAQGRGHPQKGGPEVGAQSDVWGILGRQQGGRLRQLPVGGRAKAPCGLLGHARRRLGPPPSRNCCPSPRGPRSGRLC